MTGSSRVRVILMTDGDTMARQAVETAARNLGLRVISASAGNPTPLTGYEIVRLVKKAPYDPVLVMVDDRGHPGQGAGEQALIEIVGHPEIRVLGAVAVAADSRHSPGVAVHASVTRWGAIAEGAVNKDGEPVEGELHGDTVNILRTLDLPVMIGVGDLGKQFGADSPLSGAALTTQAILEILARTEGAIPTHSPTVHLSPQREPPAVSGPQPLDNGHRDRP